MTESMKAARLAQALRLDFGKSALYEARERAQLFHFARLADGHLLWTEVERHLSDDEPPIPSDGVAA